MSGTAIWRRLLLIELIEGRLNDLEKNGLLPKGK